MSIHGKDTFHPERSALRTPADPFRGSRPYARVRIWEKPGVIVERLGHHRSRTGTRALGGSSVPSGIGPVIARAAFYTSPNRNELRDGALLIGGDGLFGLVMALALTHDDVEQSPTAQWSPKGPIFSGR
jgi:hypothetical protein